MDVVQPALELRVAASALPSYPMAALKPDWPERRRCHAVDPYARQVL